jgi:alpha-1,6-mannosyltransferase
MHEQLMKSAKSYPVTFRGFVANRTLVAEILASADISLAPGPIETFCLAALESLASGVPVVTSETNAVREFINIDAAEPLGAIAANNGASFADAIERVIALKACDSELSEKCFHQSENFPWSSTIGLMLRLHGERFVGARSIHRLKVA